MINSQMLLVDDCGPVHTLVRTCLEPEPLVIHSEYNGDAAMSAAIELKPTIILLDIGLPGTDGFEVCRRLKSARRTKDSAILFLSADASAEKIARGLELGAIDYITKPFNPDKLRARVRSAIRAQHRASESTLVDRLTGLWNQSYLTAHLNAQLREANHSGSELACITAEIDPLGRADERFDDVAGEEMLRAVADILLRECRGSDDTVYFCGDLRLTAVLPGTTYKNALRVADRIRRRVERELSRDDGGALLRCSVGVAGNGAGHEGSVLNRANAAALRAKQFSRHGVLPRNMALQNA